MPNKSSKTKLTSSKITKIDIHIAKKLRQFRLFSGLTQEELGSLVGVSFQQIQKYENCQDRISASRLFSFSQILQISVEQFFEKIKLNKEDIYYPVKSQKKIQNNKKSLAKEIIPLVTSFRKIKEPDDRRMLSNLAKSLAKN